MGREEYNKAAEELNRASHDLFDYDKEVGQYDMPVIGSWQKELEGKRNEAHARLNDIIKNEIEEGTKLNEEYDRLFKIARESLDTLHQFEKEKLGMHQEKPEGELPNPEVDREVEE